jgi:hypothetical protein
MTVVPSGSPSSSNTGSTWTSRMTLSAPGRCSSTPRTQCPRRSRCACSMWLRSSTGRYESSRSWNGRPASRGPIANSRFACRLLVASRPSVSRTTCAAGEDSQACWRSAVGPSSGSTELQGGTPLRALRSADGRTSRRLNSRLDRSTGANWAECDSRSSALPRNSTPCGSSAKCNRSSTRCCVWALKYMRVLRHRSRSTCEMGASWTRSLRPKITDRRRSLRKTYRVFSRSKNVSRRSGSTFSTSAAE